LIESKDFEKIPTELNKTMRSLQFSLKGVEQLSKGDKRSRLSTQLIQTLKEIANVSKETQKLLKKLDKKPNALIFGN